MASFREELSERVSAVFTNWSESDLPVGRRFGVALRNAGRRFRTGGCCGNHGQPGC
jgi:hypothetical protein